MTGSDERVVAMLNPPHLGELLRESMDPDLADAYRAASDQDRRKLDFLLNLRLRDVTRTDETLHDVMAGITQNARARGLTPEILEELLRD